VSVPNLGDGTPVRGGSSKLKSRIQFAVSDSRHQTKHIAQFPCEGRHVNY